MFTQYSNMSTFNSDYKRLLSPRQPTGVDWMKQEKILMEPFEYTHKVPCKQYTLLVPAFNHWLRIPDDKLNAIQEACQAWCTWNIMFDDIEDDSSLRFGVPAAHCVFGVGLTINAANNALLKIQRQIADLGHPLGIEITTKRMEETLRGQGIDLYWRDKCICPTEEAHIEMTRNKVGASFALAVELMQLFSTSEIDYTEFAITLGTYYEIVDDYYNLFNQKALALLASVKQENFTSCSDITDGKITLAVIHASQFPDVATELADILKQRTRDPKLHSRAISLLKKHGSDEYVRDKLRTLAAGIRNEIERLGGNPILTAIMDELSV